MADTAKPFELTTQTSGGVIDFPHPVVMQRGSDAGGAVNGVSAAIDRFKKEFDGAMPEAVAIPVVSTDGLLFDVPGLPGLRSGKKLGLGQVAFGEVVAAVIDLGVDVYLSIDPRLQFLTHSAYHLVDVVGSVSQHLCIYRPKSRNVIAAIMSRATQAALEAVASVQDSKGSMVQTAEDSVTVQDTSIGRVRGWVIDCVDLYGMSGENGRMHLTCFCPDCTKRITAVAGDSFVAKFRKFPNPWSLLLRDTDDGIEHIDAFRSTDGPDRLVGLSKQKGFDAQFKMDDTPLADHAATLKEYLEIRHQMTVEALHDIFGKAGRGFSNNLDRCIIIEGDSYLWTSGMYQDLLDGSPPPKGNPPKNGDWKTFDELWIDEGTGIKLNKAPYRVYHWRRARYVIDNFFQTATSASDAAQRASTGIARLSEKQLESLVRGRLAQALSGRTGSTAVAPGEEDDYLGDAPHAPVGFVSVALTKEVGERLMTAMDYAPGLKGEGAASRTPTFAEFLRRMPDREESSMLLRQLLESGGN